MIRQFRKYAVWAAVLLLMLSFANTVGAKPPEPVKLKVLLLPLLVFGPFLIAEEEGYFEEQGIEAEFVKMDGSEKAIPALIRGDLDVIAGNAGVALLNAIARGGNIRIVANKGYISSEKCTAFGLLARKELFESGKPDNLSQLKGCRFAIESLSPDGYYVEKLLNREGLTLHHIEIRDIPPPVILKAMDTGAIDVAHVGEPWITRILNRGNAVLWMPAGDIIPEFPWTVITYGPNLLQNAQEIGKRFMVAYLKAVQRYNQGKTERNLDILSKHTGLDRKILQKTCWPAVRDDGRIHAESIIDFQNWGVKKGFLDKTLKEDQFWDGRFIEYAKKRLGNSSK